MPTNAANRPEEEHIGLVEQLKANRTHRELFSAEDIANSVSHGVGLGMSIAGFALLVVVAGMNAGATPLISAIIYGLTLMLLFGASTVYHSMTKPAWRRAMRIVDHSAIYLLIAGTYTPFTLVSLPPSWGWWIFGIVWSLAVVGVVYKVFFFGRFPNLSLALYLGMGWTIVVAMGPLLESLAPGGLGLLFAGGLFYTAGVVFYVWEGLFFNHAIWHLFVLGGAICHYLAILLYVMM